MVSLYGYVFNKIDGITAHYRTQNAQLNALESSSIYAACRFDDLVFEGWPEFDAKMRNKEYFNFFIQVLPFILKTLANEKNLNHNGTPEETVISFDLHRNLINGKHIANEMTLEPSNDVNIFESTHPHQLHSRPKAFHQHDLEKK